MCKLIWTTFCLLLLKKNPSEFLFEQRVKSNKQRAKSNEQRATSENFHLDDYLINASKKETSYQAVKNQENIKNHMQEVSEACKGKTVIAFTYPKENS